MMDIQFDNFRIKSDAWSIWIEEKKEGGKKGEYWARVSGYYPTFSAAAKSFVNRRFRLIGATETKEFLKQAKQIEAEVLKIIDAYENRKAADK